MDSVIRSILLRQRMKGDLNTMKKKNIFTAVLAAATATAGIGAVAVLFANSKAVHADTPVSIGTLAQLKTYFDGAGTNCGNSATLTADIDLDGAYVSGMKKSLGKDHVLNDVTLVAEQQDTITYQGIMTKQLNVKEVDEGNIFTISYQADEKLNLEMDKTYQIETYDEMLIAIKEEPK